MNKARRLASKYGKFSLLIGLIVLAFSYAMFQGGFVSWFLFYSFLPAAVYAASLFFHSFSCTGKRTFLKQEFVFQEPVRVHITIKRRSRFPLLYVIVEDQTEKPLNQQAKTLLLPGFKKTFDFHYEITQLPRGEHNFSGIRVKTGDLFGFIEKEKIITATNKIIVYPAFEEFSYRSTLHHGQAGATSATASLLPNQDTSMSVGIREYQPGDRLTWINWKATAKKNDLMTKEFEQPKSQEVLFILDCTSSPQFETAISFTASAVKSMIRKNIQVGLLTASRKRQVFLPRGGAAHEKQLFYHLAKIEDTTSVSFAQVLAEETFIARHASTIVVVTAQLTEDIMGKIRQLSRQNRSITVFLMKDTQETVADELFIKGASGIRVCIVRDKQFAQAFSEVMNR